MWGLPYSLSMMSNRLDYKFCLHIVPDNCPKKNWLPVTCQSLFNGGISVLPIIKLQE